LHSTYISVAPGYFPENFQALATDSYFSTSAYIDCRPK